MRKNCIVHSLVGLILVRPYFAVATCGSCAHLLEWHQKNELHIRSVHIEAPPVTATYVSLQLCP